MKKRPILMSAPMVRALLDGSKTQTRRALRMPHGLWETSSSGDLVPIPASCPYGKPGDRLWVREAHAIVPRTAYRCSEGVEQVLRPDDDHDAAIYREGWTRSRSGFSWRPSIHMPRWASRITLEITGVRVERLQDISEADAMAEGICKYDNGTFGLDDPGACMGTSAIIAYMRLWEHINGPGSWEANPWVWVVSFRRIEA